MSPPEDAVRRIHHDPAAFEAFYRAHLDAVLGFIARRVDDAQTAADLTTDVFLAAIDSADRYRVDKGAPAAWLFGIARNVMADEVRRRVKEARTSRRIAGQRSLEFDAVANIEARIDAERAAREVYRGLADLSGRDRALIELVAIDGLAVTEAATVLGMSPGNARVRLHRSRTRLRGFVNIDVPDQLEVVR